MKFKQQGEVIIWNWRAQGAIIIWHFLIRCDAILDDFSKIQKVWPEDVALQSCMVSGVLTFGKNIHTVLEVTRYLLLLLLFAYK